VATTLQQLLDGLTERATDPQPSATIEDVTGALAHLGRALTGLADDGLTPGNSMRQRTVTELATACATVGKLWPRTGGPLTDLAGAAADLIGRDRTVMGLSHRWSVTVEVAEAADHSARLAHRLLPQAAVVELTAVRNFAAVVERDAQTDPPTATGAVILDRLVPIGATSRGPSGVTALDASAALVAALDRAQRTDDLTLREFRAAIAAAEITSRSAATVTAAATGDDVGPLLVTGLAWQLAGRTSTVFDDGRRAGPADPQGVVAWARALAGALRTESNRVADLAAVRDGRVAPHLTGKVQQITGQLPVLADQLIGAVDRWSRNGRLYASARDLPPMADMPEDRIKAVIARRHVRASGADLDRLRQVVGQAADLSTGLADALHRAAGTRPLAPAHQRDRHVPRTRAPVAAERQLSQAQSLNRDITTIQSSHRTAREAPPSR
jgi:hypothetical protein